MRILVVEDDDLLGTALKAGLAQAGHIPDWVRDGESALAAVRTDGFDAILLDINLPGLSGLDVLRAVRVKADLPVIIMTARDALDARIEGLDLGADDYIVKPFALAELMARLRAVGRRSHGRARPTLRRGDIEIDTAARSVRKSDDLVRLTAREYQVLVLLMERAGRVVGRADIEAGIYGWEAGAESNTIEAAIYTLRRKLGAGLIETVRGVGYTVRS
ncbi:response regulator transcription factor [Asticcacaulis sp.]|uniref:response regulator transcription factor n=1 Tax=Asticcacaulis sp. TaxID=1872648 RepID=UPI003F7BD2B3